MKIASAELQISQEHTFYHLHQEQTLTVREQVQDQASLRQTLLPEVDISPKGKALSEQKGLPDPMETLSPEDRLKASIVQILYEQVTGKSLSAEELFSCLSNGQVELVDANSGEAINVQSVETITVEHYEYLHEIEQMDFSAAGQLTTSDGRSIAFSLSMSLSREFEQESYSYEKRTIVSGDMQDPLILHLDGALPTFGSEHVQFDLDGDGAAESFQNLGSKSAFLALDKNGDGKINDGSELFGPESGHGFQELAAYDDDHNGWIDENDAVFSKLQLLQFDGDKQIMRSIAAKDIGAISLANLSSPYRVTDEHNESIAALKRSGIYLYENGEAGNLSEFDLRV